MGMEKRIEFSPLKRDLSQTQIPHFYSLSANRMTTLMKTYR